MKALKLEMVKRAGVANPYTDGMVVCSYGLARVFGLTLLLSRGYKLTFTLSRSRRTGYRTIYLYRNFEGVSVRRTNKVGVARHELEFDLAMWLLPQLEAGLTAGDWGTDGIKMYIKIEVEEIKT